MALTADQITAQNFKDFYNGIKQYLNASEHRLTSAELDEIMNIAPGANEGLPVLFDETGGERIVGWYKNSNGLKKPIYLKNYLVKITSGTSLNVQTDIYTTLSIDKVMFLYCVASGGNDGHMVTCQNFYLNSNDHFRVFIGSTGILVVERSNYPELPTECKIFLQYTKTTDSYQ